MLFTANESYIDIHRSVRSVCLQITGPTVLTMFKKAFFHLGNILGFNRKGKVKEKLSDTGNKFQEPSFNCHSRAVFWIGIPKGISLKKSWNYGLTPLPLVTTYKLSFPKAFRTNLLSKILDPLWHKLRMAPKGCLEIF